MILLLLKTLSNHNIGYYLFLKTLPFNARAFNGVKEK
jgi:hypothetical protein